MALVKYIEDNFQETIGFLTDDSEFRDYIINVIPVMLIFNKMFTRMTLKYLLLIHRMIH